MNGSKGTRVAFAGERIHRLANLLVPRVACCPIGLIEEGRPPDTPPQGVDREEIIGIATD
jgi:hypothetical protein